MLATQLENPQALWALIGVVLLGAMMIWWGYRRPHTFSFRRLFLVSLGFIFCVLAFSRPQLGERVSSPQRVSSNLYVALDISKSMLAEDIGPSRLIFAIEFCKKLLPMLPDTKVALFPFALHGFLQLPLTSDVPAVLDQISTVHPSMTTAQGTDISETLKTLFTRIVKTEEAVRERNGDWVPARVLLLSDGETHVPLNKSIVEQYQKKKIPIFTVGIGTDQGVTIPAETRFGASMENLRGPDGRNVRTKMDAQTLKQIATGSGGDYYSAQFSEVNRLAQRLNQSLALGRLQSTFKLKQEFFPILFGIALLFFLIEFCFGRWEYLIRSVVIFAFLFTGTTARAASNEDPATQAIQKYNAGVTAANQQDLKKAAEHFEEAAITSDDPAVKKQGYYNLGNMLLKMGDPTSALQVYQQAYDIPLNNQNQMKEINKRISDNIELAAQMENQMKMSGQSDENSKDKDQGTGKQPTGPQRFKPQQFSEQQKQKIWDMVSNEEKQSQQRLRDQQTRGSGQVRTEKPW